MKQFSFILTGRDGFNPASAGKIAETAKRFRAQSYFFHQEKCADGKKIFQLLGLRPESDDCVYVLVRGADEAEAVLALRHCLEDLFESDVCFSSQRPQYCGGERQLAL